MTWRQQEAPSPNSADVLARWDDEDQNYSEHKITEIVKLCKNFPPSFMHALAKFLQVLTKLQSGAAVPEAQNNTDKILGIVRDLPPSLIGLFLKILRRVVAAPTKTDVGLRSTKVKGKSMEEKESTGTSWVYRLFGRILTLFVSKNAVIALIALIALIPLITLITGSLHFWVCILIFWV